GGMMTGYALAAAGAALFSTKAIFIKLAYQDLANGALLLAWRMIFALPVFVIVGVLTLRRRRLAGQAALTAVQVLRAIGTGFIGYYVAAILDFKGLEYISAQMERLVLFTYPIFVMLLGWAFFGQRLTRLGLLGGFITYCGLAVVFGSGLFAGGEGVITGTLLVLGAALSFALYQLLAKRNIQVLGAALFTAISLSTSAVAAILHYMVESGGMDFSAPPRFLMLAAGTAVIATILPSFLMNAGMAKIGPQSVAMISTLSPVVTIALAVWILGEPFTWADALGSALVLAGVGIYTLGDSRAAGRAR
ncbi:MAG TPA: DMT family transporter, partial [Aestuariivirga sp.]|nr:DMT family transporter [Aestuariivirga sp.]